MRALTNIILFALLACAAPALAERMAVPGSSVSLDLPAGFTPAEAFAGFGNEETQSSILVTELPAEAYAELSALMSNLEGANAALAAQQVTIDTIETVTAGPLELLVLHGEQQAGGATIDKWIVIVSAETTVMLTLNLMGGETPDEVRALLASLEVAPPSSLEEQLAALPFAAMPEAPFTEQTTLAGSTIGLYTEPGTDPSGLKPRIIVAWQLSGAVPDDADAVGRQLLANTALGPVAIAGSTAATFVGLPAVRHDGVYDQDGTPMRVVQYTVILESRFVRLVATMQESEAAALLPVIERIAGSIRTQGETE